MTAEVPQVFHGGDLGGGINNHRHTMRVRQLDHLFQRECSRCVWRTCDVQHRRRGIVEDKLQIVGRCHCTVRRGLPRRTDLHNLDTCRTDGKVVPNPLATMHDHTRGCPSDTFRARQRGHDLRVVTAYAGSGCKHQSGSCT